MQAGGAAQADPIEEVAAALAQDPEGTIKQLQSMGDQGKQILQAVLQKHPELQQIFGGGQEVPAEKNGGEVPIEQEYYTSNELKCGGKVKKGEKGLPIPSKKVTKNAQGGCPCKLHRVGGKIVEVDSCSGMPIRRSGGKVGGLIDKKEPGGPLTSYGWAAALSEPEAKEEEEEGRTKYAYRVIGLDKQTGEVKLLGRTDNPYQFTAYEQGLINGWKTGGFPYPSENPDLTYFDTNGDTFTATKDPNTGLISAVVPQGGERTNGQVTVQDSAVLPIENNPELAAVKADVAARQQAAAEEAKKKQQKAFRGAFDAAGLGEYQSFSARKKFIADNKAWLHAKGFNVNNYTGTSEQNKALIKLLKEYKANPAANIAMRVVDGEPEYQVNGTWVDRDMLSPAELQRALDQNAQAPYAAQNVTLSIPAVRLGGRLKH